MIFVAALVSCWWLARRNATAIGVDGSHMDLLLPLAIVGGVVGGTLLSLLMPNDRMIAGEALEVGLRLRFFGIVVSGSVAVFIYSRLTGQSFRSYLDALALPTIVALAIHRIGCFYAGCCWGDVSVHDPWLSSIATTELGQQLQTLPWLAGEWIWTGVQYAPGTFPYEQHLAAGLIDDSAAMSLPVHPVQLYELVLLLVAYLFLRRIPLQDSYPGTIAALTTIVYTVIRFGLEYIRADGVLLMGNLTATQLQCIALLVIALSAVRGNLGKRPRLAV